MAHPSPILEAADINAIATSTDVSLGDIVATSNAGPSTPARLTCAQGKRIGAGRHAGVLDLFRRRRLDFHRVRAGANRLAARIGQAAGEFGAHQHDDRTSNKTQVSSTTKAPAGPYAPPTLLWLMYSPIANLPTMKEYGGKQAATERVAPLDHRIGQHLVHGAEDR